jgi:hypothetical protein
MAETEIGKALQGLVDAGEKMVQAIKAAKDALKAYEDQQNPPPPDDELKESPE